VIYLFEFLRYPIALVFIGYSLYGLWSGTIRVGSRSYTGGVVSIRRDESPLRFHFWCAFFFAMGVLAFSVPLIDTA